MILEGHLSHAKEEVDWGGVDALKWLPSFAVGDLLGTK